MTEIPIFYRQGKVCYDIAGSLRDTVANIIILLPSLRTLNPQKHKIECMQIGRDKAVVKFYRSNRGVPYLTIFDNKLNLKYSFEGKIDPARVRDALEKMDIPPRVVAKALLALGLE